MMAARWVLCIALYPVGNATGLWALWKIETGTRFRHANMIKLVTSELNEGKMKLSLRLQKQHKVLQLTKETCCMEDLRKDQGET